MIDQIKVEVNSEGIKETLSRFKYSEQNFPKSVVEYIWNGFDAGATSIEIEYEFASAGFRKLIISDNGSGINKDELSNKFLPVFSSEKLQRTALNDDEELFHGKKGFGRLTFFCFCNSANWITTYLNNLKIESYSIEINSDNLDKYSTKDLDQINIESKTGTKVIFNNFHKTGKYEYGKNTGEKELRTYLIKEFAWYLELNKQKGYNIKLNGEILNYSSIIHETETQEQIIHDNIFCIHYFCWNEPLHNQSSRFYFLNESGKEICSETTLLNNKGDKFFHSVFIKSSYFNDFNADLKNNQTDILNTEAKSSKTYIELLDYLNNFLKQKRKPFLRAHAEILIEQFEKEGIIQKINKDSFEKIHLDDLKNVIQEIYVLQPKIFASKINPDNKKVLVNLLDLVINSDDRDKIIDIVQSVIDLSKEEIADFHKILQVTDLNRIINSINFIAHRIQVLKALRTILFNPDYNTTERDHLQKLVENNTWIFGEKYHLISKSYDDFEKALLKYRNTVFDENSDDIPNFDDPRKGKRMDIFIVKQDRKNEKIQNFIIELKHPKRKLGKKEYDQIDEYVDIIKKSDQFNGKLAKWEFVLLGNAFSSNGYIENKIKSQNGDVEKGEIFLVDNFTIYARTWSDILDENESRLHFIDERLQLEREKLKDSFKNAEEAVEVTISDKFCVK